MATLVLTAVGTAVGGPVGGAIGALIGGAADRSLLGSKGRKGPRLGDLRVQTSSYGSALPRLYGRLRVAGTVIWATDLREDRTTSGGGKAGPKATSYSYSASFAVALSARAIRGVGRIWADGRLLRGSAGDWKTRTGFRLHLGTEDQAADPLIAAAEGIADCPAYRGIAYAVFEDMALADYGNRIPSLTFEVEADDGGVAVGAIAADLAGEGLAGSTGPVLDGFAAAGATVRDVLETLAEAAPLVVTDDGARLRLDAPPDAATVVPAGALGAAAGEARADRRSSDQVAAGLLPRAVTIAYHDPQRDWQAGMQRARRQGATGPVQAIDLPAGLPAGEARRLAEAELARRWTEARRLTLHLPWRWLALRPGMHLVVPGEAGRWRIVRATLEEMVWTVDLARAAAGVLPAPAAAPGRAVQEADRTAGTTLLALIDLPPLDGTETGPALWVAAAGTGTGWRRASLSVSLDDGAGWTGIGETAAPAVLGTAVTALPSGDPALFDRVNGVLVDLANDGMALAGADDAQLIAGANAALLGEELIQFGQATQIGPRRWRLERLLRGRRGTEAAVAGHAPGERFVAVERAALAAVALPFAQAGRSVRVSGRGPDEAADVTADAIATLRALRPPSPVFLRAERMEAGVRLRWIRRSRAGWAWLDGADAPLGEEAERYRIELQVGGATVRTAEVGQPWFDYPDADRAGDGTGAGFVLSVRQLGQAGASDPATGQFA